MAAFAKNEAEIAVRVSRYLKAELKRADVSYEELAQRLKEHGLDETRDSIAANLERGYFCSYIFSWLLGGVGSGRNSVRGFMNQPWARQRGRPTTRRSRTKCSRRWRSESFRPERGQSLFRTGLP